jgi:hypothetical protein
MGIYDVGVTGLPTALIADAGEISATVTTDRLIAILEALDEGFYWAALVTNGTPSVYGFSAASRGILGQSLASSLTNQFAVTRSLTYGALPDPFGAATYASTGPKIALVTV